MGKTRTTRASPAPAARGRRKPFEPSHAEREADRRALEGVLARAAGEEGEAARRAWERVEGALATKPRPRPKNERERLLQAIEDAERDYQVALQDRSHQAADRCRRHKQELEVELVALGTVKPERSTVRRADPDAGRVAWLRSHLEEIEADLEYLRRTEQWATIPAMERAAADAREELDKARKEDAGALELDRSPAAVAARILEKAERLRELAALERR